MVAPKEALPKVLCLSRSYLSHLLPEMGKRDTENQYLHIVQTTKEAKLVEELGGTVILNLQEVVRRALASPAAFKGWSEPDDFRKLNDFNWSSIYQDRYLGNFSHENQRLIAGAIFEELSKIFAEHEFKAFLSEPVALFTTHVIFYFCQKNGVKPLLWCNTYFADNFYFANETNISKPVGKAVRSAEDTLRLHNAISTYVDEISEDRTGPIYHHSFSKQKEKPLQYFEQRKGKSPLVLKTGWHSRIIQIARLIRSFGHRLFLRQSGDFMTAGAVREHWFYLKCLFVGKKPYDTVPQEYSDKNVVYPLQYEPEASLLYFAPYIVDQQSFIETVLKALPDDRILWVKEHPNQFGALGTNGWRKLKRKYGNLRFIHGRQNGRELIKRCSLAITIASTMGMDALIMGRRVLVAGDVFFEGFTGAIKVQSYQELAYALNEQSNYDLQKNKEANKAELIEFSHSAYAGDPQPSQNLFKEENLSQLVAAVQTEVRECLQC